jgi:hypothetical protein
MSKLRDYLHTAILTAVSALAVSLLGAADYFGFAVFGESADQQAPSQQSHGTFRFHK